MKHLLHTWYRSFAGLVVLLALIALCGNPAIAAPSLKALIIDGQNNHNWQGTTPVLREILLESGLFQVDTVTTPAQGKLMDSFRPDFSGYDVLVMNYTGDDWPKETQIAFESYVRNGGGLVIFHAANNAFPQWQEFNEMIGVGGWGGRNEKSGPMLYYEDGQLKEDNSPGPGGAHGPQVEYQVVTRNTEHPIMKDLPASWLHVADECYAKLRGPAKNITLLATALSELTNRHEPMLFTIQYHKGRVFHTALGHDAQQLRCVGTAFTLQRGTEWAATGNVTLPVPENFPTENKTSLRPLPVSYKTIIAYEPNQSRKELAALEENIRLATPSQLANIEAELDTILTAPQATFWAKQFACQVLRRIATAQSLPALTQCLNDDKLFDTARYALERMVCDQVNGILLAALDQREGDFRLGLIHTLAQRQCQDAVAKLVPFLQSEDAALVDTTIKALGHIGGKAAATALAEAKVADSLQDEVADALLLCADRCLEDGYESAAGAIYEKLTASTYPLQIQSAAYNGLVRAQGQGALSSILALLKSEVPLLRDTAIKILSISLPGNDSTKALISQFPDVTPATRALILKALQFRNDPFAIPLAVKASECDDESVRLAAIEALGVLGTKLQVAHLAELCNKGGKEADAAINSLCALRGDGIDHAIQALLTSQNEQVRTAILRCVVRRQAGDVLATLLQFAQDPSVEVRKEAWRGLTDHATEAQYADLVALLGQATDANELRLAEIAVEKLGGQMQSAAMRDAILATALPVVSATAKQALFPILTKFGGYYSCQAMTAVLGSGDPVLRKAALDALCNWPDASPLATLEGIMKTETDAAARLAAMKGFLNAVHLDNTLAGPALAQKFTAAMEAAQTQDEKKTVLDAAAKREDYGSLAFFETILNDPERGAEAKANYRKIAAAMQSSEISRESLRLTASHNSNDTKNAIDGNKNSRWATGTSQVPGMWLQIDLGSDVQVQKIVLDATGSNSDAPAAYKVFVSSDPQKWGAPVAEGKGSQAKLEITPTPVRGRYIRIEQTGEKNGLFWSIHELQIFKSSDQGQLDHVKDVLKQIGE